MGVHCVLALDVKRDCFHPVTRQPIPQARLRHSAVASISLLLRSERAPLGDHQVDFICAKQNVLHQLLALLRRRRSRERVNSMLIFTTLNSLALLLRPYFALRQFLLRIYIMRMNEQT